MLVFLQKIKQSKNWAGEVLLRIQLKIQYSIWAQKYNRGLTLGSMQIKLCDVMNMLISNI